VAQKLSESVILSYLKLLIASYDVLGSFLQRCLPPILPAWPRSKWSVFSRHHAFQLLSCDSWRTLADITGVSSTSLPLQRHDLPICGHFV